MGLSKQVGKLEKYLGRLKAGKTQKIKPCHVERIITKLEVHERELQSELAATRKETKRARLEEKLRMTRIQLERAHWLLEQLD